MKPIPENITLRIEAYGDGAKGMAFRLHRNDEFGVQMEDRRADRRSPWVRTFTSDFIPDRTFATFRELREAVHAGELKQFEPLVLTVEPKDKRGTSRCWICRGEAVHRVTAKTGWRRADQALIPCCDADLAAVKADPLAAIEARHKWVREHPIKP